MLKMEYFKSEHRVRFAGWKRYVGKKIFVIEVHETKTPLVFSEMTLRDNRVEMPKLKDGDHITVWYVQPPIGPVLVVGLDHKGKRLYRLSEQWIESHLRIVQSLASNPEMVKTVDLIAEDARMRLRTKE